MKKIYFLLVAASGALTSFAQAPVANTAPEMPTKVKKAYTHDSLLGRWVLDINGLGGMLSQDLTIANTAANYKNGLNLNTGGGLTMDNGMTYGGDVQLGFFFGRKRHFGLGTGFMYLHQEGDVKMKDVYHVEYQSVDSRGDVFRQLVTSNNKIEEKLKITNLNIPLMLKYKTRFSKRFGFAADLGVLFNVQNKNAYTTNASFDYEAIYKYSGSGNSRTLVYDNSAVPDPNSVLYTKANFAGDRNVESYFNNTLRGAGYNVGLGVRPATTTGSVSYNTGSIGFMVQPSINYFFSDFVALNVGAFYMYQPSFNDNKAGYMMTDKVGTYNSALNTVTEGVSHAYGANLGLRFFFGKMKDSDHDGVPNKTDKCPNDSGAVIFMGCPDSDGDGVPDKEDSCVNVPGLAKFGGCPDSDGDGIQDKYDACPYAPGKAEFRGCPDRDGDGIIDKDDACPDKAGTKRYQGCPDTDGDGLPDNEDKCPEVAGPADNNGCPVVPKATTEVEPIKVSTPILFELNKTVIQAASYPVLSEAVRKINEDKNALIIVDGYTDVTGKPGYNKQLSLKRANAVKAELRRMGVNPKRIKVVGHGSESPAASNDTEEGRMQNRRAVMRLNIGD